MHLGVRFSTTDRELVEAFSRALDFWVTVLDMDWHLADSGNCSIHIVAGPAAMFKPAEVARAQFPDRPAFQGLIAINTKARLSREEQYTVAVHELGHLLGLKHSSSANSVMYFLCFDGPVRLDPADLAALAARHKLRVSGTDAETKAAF
jgi:hypothetical protein